MGRHDRPGPQGCPALEFCLFEDRGERSGSIIIQRPLWGFRIEPPKAVPSASSRSPALAGGASQKWLAMVLVLADPPAPAAAAAAGCAKICFARCIDEAGSFRDCQIIGDRADGFRT